MNASTAIDKKRRETHDHWMQLEALVRALEMGLPIIETAVNASTDLTAQRMAQGILSDLGKKLEKLAEEQS